MPNITTLIKHLSTAFTLVAPLTACTNADLNKGVRVGNAIVGALVEPEEKPAAPSAVKVECLDEATGQIYTFKDACPEGYTPY